jgi:hypothetical protein
MAPASSALASQSWSATRPLPASESECASIGDSLSATDRPCMRIPTDTRSCCQASASGLASCRFQRTNSASPWRGISGRHHAPCPTPILSAWTNAPTHISTRLLSDGMKVCPCIRGGLGPDRALGAPKKAEPTYRARRRCAGSRSLRGQSDTGREGAQPKHLLQIDYYYYQSRHTEIQ